MGREKKPGPAAAAAGPGVTAKERHKRAVRRENNNDWAAPLPQGLVALPEKHRVKSKHQSYFEIVENSDKKKKLEFQVTNDKNPPPGFEFVPIGNPELTTACKELSREQDAMIFIVSSAKDTDDKKLSIHLHRIGHHIRQTIVEQAREALGQDEYSSNASNSGEPEPIPETQEEINAQADAALKDLFPRIPNFDRQSIIEHAFKKGGKFGGEPVVGMAADIPLSRRVQLAVLAHIRHNHTRYDKLLKETSYVNARKAVEALCLDILVKWRGDEETGRDQLDEILREVVVISDDSEDEVDEDSESSDDDSVQEIRLPGSIGASDPSNLRSKQGLPHSLRRQHVAKPGGLRKRKAAPGAKPSSKPGSSSAKTRAAAKKGQRGFKRYEAAAQREAHYQAAWEQALNRNRHQGAPDLSPFPLQMNNSTGQGSRQAGANERDTSHRDLHGDVDGRDYLPANRQPSHVDASRPIEPFYVERMPPVSHSGLRPTPPAPQSTIPTPTHSREVARPIRYRPVSGPPGMAHENQPPVSAPTRQDPNELKDFLVRSIEPVSPSSAPMPPQFVRPMPYREHVPLEQVSSGTYVQNARYRSPIMDGPQHDDAFQHRRFISDHSAPVRVLSPFHGEPSTSAPGRYRDPIPFASSQPQEAIRVYRVREPVDIRGRPAVPVDTAAARIHTGSPRPLAGITGHGANTVMPSQSRYRELSPHRVLEIRRPLDDLQRGPEVRRVVSLESGDSRYRDVSESSYIRRQHVYAQRPEGRPTAGPVEYQSFEPLSDRALRSHQPLSMRPNEMQPSAFPVYREVEQRHDYPMEGLQDIQARSLQYSNHEARHGVFTPNSRSYDDSNPPSYQNQRSTVHDPQRVQPQYLPQHGGPQQRDGVIFLR